VGSYTLSGVLPFYSTEGSISSYPLQYNYQLNSLNSNLIITASAEDPNLSSCEFMREMVGSMELGNAALVFWGLWLWFSQLVG